MVAMSGEKLRNEQPEISSRANSLSRSIRRAREKRGATSSSRGSLSSRLAARGSRKRNDKSSALKLLSIAQMILRPKATVLQVTV